MNRAKLYSCASVKMNKICVKGNSYVACKKTEIII